MLVALAAFLSTAALGVPLASAACERGDGKRLAKRCKKKGKTKENYVWGKIPHVSVDHITGDMPTAAKKRATLLSSAYELLTL
jgi:hypothetical protein